MIALRAATIVLLLIKAVAWFLVQLARRHLTGDECSRDEMAGMALHDLMEDLGPTFIKVGQLLGTRRDLFSPELASHLASLQDDVTPTSFNHLRVEFSASFGVELEAVFMNIDEVPVASASIASVFKGRLRDGRVVAVKIRKPGVSRVIENDVRLLRFLIRVAERLPFLAAVPLREVFEEVSAAVVGQADFVWEARSNKRLTEALREEKFISLPYLVESYCSRSILTMEYFDDLLVASELPKVAKRAALANSLCALYRMIFIEGFVHCDMHPGNLHLLDAGTVRLVDFGMMAELEPDVRTRFAEFFYSMVVNDGYTCSEITLETAVFVPPDIDKDSFREEIVALVHSCAGRRVTGFQVAGFVVGMFDIQRRYGVRGTSTFMMAIMSLLVFEGVAKEIDPDLDFQTYSIPYVQKALNMRRPAGKTPNTTNTARARQAKARPE